MLDIRNFINFLVAWDILLLYIKFSSKYKQEMDGFWRNLSVILIMVGLETLSGMNTHCLDYTVALISLRI